VKDIDDWRRDIDAVDARLVALLNERARCVVEIGKLKGAQGLPVQAPGREAEVIARWRELTAAGPLDGDAIERLYRAVLAESYLVENQHTTR
jgi:chorismate mutase-like protein